MMYHTSKRKHLTKRYATITLK